MTEAEWLAAEQKAQAAMFRQIARVCAQPEHTEHKTINDLHNWIVQFERELYEKLGDCPTN